MWKQHWFRLTIAASILASVQPVEAQIVPDQSLGSERSSLTQNVQIRGGVGNRIDGGAIRGSNLFHSFDQFNVNTGQRVYFSNPIGIQNILTRITGSNRSIINGTLGVDGTANLFLLNPNGIVFGQNAQLDIRGSFIPTTANAICFEGQGQFSATNPSAVPLLTVNPSALLYTQLQGGGIVNQGATLAVLPGQSLLLVGGDVKQEGGVLYGSDGRVELGGLAALGSVGLTQINGILSLIFPDGVERSNVSILNSGDNAGGIFGTGNRGGSIGITAKNFVMEGQKNGLLAGIYSGAGGIGARAGDITIDTTDSVTLSQSGSIANNVLSNIVGDGGNILIKTGTLLVQDGFFINTVHFGQGNGGDILITGRDRVTFSGVSSISTLAVAGQGRAGNIQITTGSLFVKSGGFVQTNSERTGNSGNITINARDAVVLDGSAPVQIEGVESQAPSSISADIGFNGVGNGGDIAINTGTFTVTNGGSLSSAIEGRGNAGTISINARDSVLISGNTTDSAGIFSSQVNSSVSGVGNGGNIKITTGSLAVTSGGNISADTYGQGNAGNIAITARDRVQVDGETQDAGTLFGKTFNVNSSISSGVGLNSPSIGLASIGKGGEIRIDTGDLWVTNGGDINTDTAGLGNAGNITINARDRIAIAGAGKLSGESNISSRVLGSVLPDGTSFRAIGQGGTLNLSANQVTLSNGGYISSSTAGDGNAGSISISAPGSITISGVSPLNEGSKSRINASTSSGSTGQGGDVLLQTGALSILDNGLLSSSNVGTGNAGSIRAQTSSIALKDNSSIQTLTTFGNGGNVFLGANDYLLMRRGSSITASATATPTQQNAGNSGNITIDANQIVAPLEENNTIAANATKGNGGNVTINTQGLYGIQPRLQAIPGISSITASSELGVQGQITVTQPQIQPVQGTIALPTSPIPDNQIAQVCPRNSDTAKLGSFTLSGRGSAPPNPIDAISGNTPISTLATLESSASTAVALPKQSPVITEAQGWIKTRDGKVVLVAQPSEAAPSIQAACPPHD